MQEIKKQLRPEKKIFEVAEKFLKSLQADGVKFELGGSVAKRTNLKGSADIDIFARFKDDNAASDKLQEVLESYNPERIHGSRDYFQISYQGYCIEVVPVKLINDPKKANNVTDMSPLHVKWANKKLNDKLRDEIRLAKQFCKAQKIYGAESHIQGISGHVIDIFVIYYGTFIQLLKQASVWGDKVIIDIEKHGTAKELNKSKRVSPLIVIDPIQPERNAAAGLNKESFNKFKESAIKFLETQDKEMFVIKDLDEESFKKKHKNVVIIHYQPLEGKDDVVGSKIRQAINYIRKNTQEFYPTEIEWDFNKALFAFKEKKLNKKMILQGPPRNKLADSKKFEKAHKNTFTKDGRVYAEEEREYLIPEEKIKSLIKEKYVKERMRKITC